MKVLGKPKMVSKGEALGTYTPRVRLMGGATEAILIRWLAPTEIRLWGQNYIVAPTEIRLARSQRYK